MQPKIVLAYYISRLFKQLGRRRFYLQLSPRRLIFSWWGCYGLYLRHKPTELAHSFDSVLVSVSVLMGLSPVFDLINSTDNSPLSHSSLLV